VDAGGKYGSPDEAQAAARPIFNEKKFCMLKVEERKGGEVGPAALRARATRALTPFQRSPVDEKVIRDAIKRRRKARQGQYCTWEKKKRLEASIKE